MLQDLLAQFGACLPFQPRFWTFVTPRQVQLPKWECTWESLGFIPCTLPHFWKCVSHLNTLSWLHGPLHYTFNREPNVKVATFQQMCPMIMFHTLTWKEFDNIDELTFEKMEVFLHGYRWDENRSKSFIK
jgi:hypothetical protein